MRRILLLLLACACVLRAADDVEALKQRIAELEQEIVELKSRSVPFSALMGEQVQVYCWHVLDDKGDLSKEVRAMLNLSDPEAKAIDAAIKQARQRIADAVAAQHPKPEIADNKLTLTVGKFRESGKKAQDELRKALSDTLGHDRSAFFDKLSQSNLGNSFMQFGDADYTYTLDKSGAMMNYKIEAKSEHGSSSSSGGANRLGEEFELVKQYIPPEYGGTACAKDAPAPKDAAAAPAPTTPKTRSDF